MDAINFQWDIGRNVVAFTFDDKILSDHCSSWAEVDFAAEELKRHIDTVAARMKIAIEIGGLSRDEPSCAGGDH